MAFRISPLWWPVLTIASPAVLPWLLVKNRRFKENRAQAAAINAERIEQAEPLNMPELDFLEMTVLVDWHAKEGFAGDSGVSYMFKTELGSMLFDVGFGPTRPALSRNAAKIGFNMEQVDALAISHLHADHMGGIAAQRSGRVTLPDELMPSRQKFCFLPDRADAEGFEAVMIEKPRLISAGIASTGPLARSLFIMGFTEEQALLAKVKDKGLVVFTGCGHPTIEVILEMVGRLSKDPIYAICGGLHFPVTEGRGNRAGIKFQMMAGTGKPPWQRITDEDLSQTISSIKNSGPKRVCLSGHDSCDYALDRMINELDSETEVLKAGESYRF
ncbi:MAG: MBL fold metallo-hydrolase [Desulfobacterales bacterium]